MLDGTRRKPYDLQPGRRPGSGSAPSARHTSARSKAKMSGGNVWSLVGELDNNNSQQSSVSRSSSFGTPHRKRSQQVIKTPNDNNKPEEMRPRSSSLSMKERPVRKDCRASVSPRKLSIPAPPPISRSTLDPAQKRGWRMGSFRTAGKKGIELLKKAGEKAQEIMLTAQDSSKDSETSEEQPSARTVESNDEFFDAVSTIVQTPESKSGIGIVPHIEIRRVSPSPRSSIASSAAQDTQGQTVGKEPEPDQFDDMKKIFVVDPNCPIHGTKPFKRTRFKSIEVDSAMGGPTPLNRYLRPSLASIMSYSSVSENEYSILTSQAYAAKLARKRRRANLSGSEKERVDKEKFKIQMNLIVISLAFLFLLSAFHGLQNLQNSVNGQDGLGAMSLGVVYLALGCSSLFLPPYMLSRLGCKRTLLLCMAMFALYMLVNFLPRWYSLIPASVLLGVSASCLWAAKCTYLTEMGLRYAQINVESPSVVIVRFFGIFFMIVHLGQVFGNLISSVILEASIGANQRASSDRVEKTCGHYFEENGRLSVEATQNLQRPPQPAFLAVCGVYICCTLVATFIVAAFLNTLRKDEQARKEEPQFAFTVWQKTIESLRTPKPLLLIPLTIFNGMEQAFIVGEYTKAYVGCCLGISQIGFVMMSFGLADAICSLFFGPLIQLFGRMPLFVFGAVVDMLMIFTLLVWPPNPGDTAIFYVIAAAWGMADGVWNTQINGFWVALLSPNLEVAFANYRLWESIGFTISLFYTPYISTQNKLYILLGALFLGMIGYALIELWQPITRYMTKLGYVLSDLWYFGKPRRESIAYKKSRLRLPSDSSHSVSSSKDSNTGYAPDYTMHI